MEASFGVIFIQGVLCTVCGKDFIANKTKHIPDLTGEFTRKRKVLKRRIKLVS